MCRYPDDPDFPQTAADLRWWHLHRVFLRAWFIALAFLRRLKQTRLVRIERNRPTELFQITPQQFHVLFGRIVSHETREQPAGGIVDHYDQVECLSAPFQPVMLTGVPLHQFSKAAPPRPPDMHFLYFLCLRAPQLAANHPLPQRLLAHLNAVELAQI